MTGSRGASAVFGAVGDMAFTRSTLRAVEERGAGWVLDGVRPALARADVLFGNLECVTVPPGYPPAELEPTGLASAFDPGPVLRDAGFDVLNLANNHILDAGTTGLVHTTEVVEGAGMLGIGVGASQGEARRLHTLERSGLRWGFLAYAEDSNYTLSTTGPCYAYYERGAVLEDVAAARPAVDVLVVSVHGDLEFMDTPSPRRVEAFRDFAAAGATIVLGHHPHVPQGVEVVGSTLIAYSLGNFVFNAHSSPYQRPYLPAVARSFVLLARVGAGGVEDAELLPVAIGPPPAERPELAAGHERDDLGAELSRLDALLADEEVLAANWRRESLRRALATAQDGAGVRSEEDLLLRLGRLLYVAENREWVDEVARAAAEAWERQATAAHPLRRPSHRLDSARPKRGGMRRVLSRARAAARALRRRVRRA